MACCNVSTDRAHSFRGVLLWGQPSSAAPTHTAAASAGPWHERCIMRRSRPGDARVEGRRSAPAVREEVSWQEDGVDAAVDP